MASEESDMELSGSTRFSEEPKISFGEEEALDEEAAVLEEELDRVEEEAGQPDQDTVPNLAAYTRGAWRGSDMSQAEIDWLYWSRRIPEEVFCRIPGEEHEPMPNPGEVVVFTAHFERGFGLPASEFFWRFLDFYRLQPHHVPGNAVFYLSSFVSFMEGFVGLWPTVETFARFYNLRINSIQDPDLPLPKPIVQNSGPVDFINLPAYVLDAPSRTNWQYNPQNNHDETNRIIRYIKKLKKDTDLPADDINFPRISAEELESFAPRRTHEGDMDPDPFKIGNTHKMGATHTLRLGNTSASCPSRTRASDSGSEEDDCVILESVACNFILEGVRMLT
ncbi:hypothetical protein QYE76_070095 [Lolium multiflorum]|uniref:Transposase (putative) gypsy type domain-containing protein n=1 Tax=Lolium multiflorum TaxID=4521 RepID=A0AAD8SJY7_LOLMU|nr:hypothetical protein QYE76_070095 [Lolium multiflorum]